MCGAFLAHGVVLNRGDEWTHSNAIRLDAVDLFTLTSLCLCRCAYIHTYLENSVRFLNHSSLVRRQVNNTVGSVEQREMEFGCHGLQTYQDHHSPFMSGLAS